MKNFTILSVVALFGIITTAFSTIVAEETNPLKSLPSINIETLNRDSVNAKNILKNDAPTLLVFWATCCAPCKKELTAISKVYDTWQKETAVNIVAVSVDLPQYAHRVKPFVENHNWKYDVYLDVDRNLMHGMNAYSTPHTFLLNNKGDIIWEKQGFVESDESIVYNEIKKISSK